MSFFGKKEKQIVVKVEAQVPWQVMYDVRAKVYIGVCPALNLNAIGDTWIDFQQVANDAITGLFLDLFQSGEFEAFLRERGWRSSPLPPPGVRPQFDVQFDTKTVPELTAAYAN